MLFINCKLFAVARINCRNKEISPEIKKSSLFKSISGCLLVVACLLVLSIPLSVYIVLTLNSKETDITLDNAGVTGLWTATAGSMNSTFNCLIFFWKNKILRDEGMKIIKSLNICHRSQSCRVQPEQY